MSEYTLYVDESETHRSNPGSDRFFVMGGVIIKNSNYTSISSSFEELKRTIWPGVSGCENYVLHELDITFASKRMNQGNLGTVAPYNQIFTQSANVLHLYNELSKLFKLSDLTVIGVCLNKDSLYRRYGQPNLNPQYSIAIQLLLEHYCYFLIQNNGIGDICYESMQPMQNKIIRQRFDELKKMGTIYYAPTVIQSRIQNISFIPKQRNLAGLQLADFVPNTLARRSAGMKPKNSSFSSTVRKKLYLHGASGNLHEIGYKILS